MERKVQPMIEPSPETREGEAPLAIVVTGPVGSGKSTVAAELSRQLEIREVPHALIDMDYLRWVYPAPPRDAFAEGLGNRNLAAIWPNIRATSPRCVILADVVERRGRLEEYRRLMPGTDVTVVRLDVPMNLIHRRLRQREHPEALDWYLRRAPELQQIMEREEVGDMVIDVGTRPPDDIAIEILQRLSLVTP